LEIFQRKGQKKKEMAQERKDIFVAGATPVLTPGKRGMFRTYDPSMCKYVDEKKLEKLVTLASLVDDPAAFLNNVQEVGQHKPVLFKNGQLSYASLGLFQKGVAEAIAPDLVCYIQQLAHRYNVLKQKEAECVKERADIQSQLSTLKGV
jgi:hypothetical protein